MWPKEMLSREG